MAWLDLELDVSELFESVLDSNALINRTLGMSLRHQPELHDPHPDADRFIAGDEQTRADMRMAAEGALASRIARSAREEATLKPRDPVLRIREWQATNAKWQRSYEAAYRARNREKLRRAAAARRAKVKHAA